MIRIETDPLLEKEDIYSFLKHTDYRKFNLWPNVTPENVARFLSEEIDRVWGTGRILGAVRPDGIIALLVFENLDWDSQHFGFECANIRYLLTSRTSDDLIIRKCLKQILGTFQEYCVESDIRFVAAAVDSWDFRKSFALQAANFRYVLTWLDGFLAGSSELPEVMNDAEVSIIEPDEIHFFATISSEYYFNGGRFYADPGFDKRKVDRMYANIIQSSFENNDIMLVYRIKGQPVGLFISKKIVTYRPFSELRVAPLRFLIVDPRFRGRKVAQDLFVQTVKYLKNDSDLITTGLEIHNLPSSNLHSKLGFRFNYTHNVYHWWNR